MKKSNKIVAVFLALVMIITAVPMMTASADIGDILGKDEDKHEHVYVIQSVEEGSCTEVAKTTFKCACGDVQVLTTGEPAHTPAIGGYAKKNEKIHTNYCTVCKKVFEEEHKDFEYVVEHVAPTCSKAGKTVYQCSKCNAKRTEVIDPSVHIPSGIVVNDANKHGFTCVACEKLIDEEHVWDEGYVDAAIKCGDSGKIIYTCLVPGCNKTKEVTIPSACVYPDKEDIEDGFAPKINKFDEEGKNHTFECIYCSRDKVEPHEFVVSYTYDYEVISTKAKVAKAAEESTTEEPTTEEPKPEEPTTEEPTTEEPTTEHEHTWSNWEVVAASCGHDGYKVGYCECGEITSEIIPATGKHNYKWIMVQEPSLEYDGYRVKQCTECYDVAEEQYIIMTLNTPTCQEEGEILVECKYCNYSYTAAVDTIDHEIKEDAKYTKFSKEHHYTECVYCGRVKAPHTWGDWKVVTAATAEKEGKKTRVCADCGEEEVETIAKLTGILGDVNADGSVSAVDARLVLQYVAGLRDFTAKEKEMADMNADGNITAVDARVILQIVAGLK